MSVEEIIERAYTRALTRINQLVERRERKNRGREKYLKRVRNSRRVCK